MLLSTYTLSYDTSIYSFLSKISLKSNGKEVNPLMFYYGGESDESRFQTSTAFLETYFANSKLPILSCIRVSLILLPGVRGLSPILILNLMASPLMIVKGIVCMEVDMILRRICWFIRILATISAHQ